MSDQRTAVVLFWCLSFNLYKFFKVHQFLLDFLFADLFVSIQSFYQDAASVLPQMKYSGLCCFNGGTSKSILDMWWL